MATAIKKGAVVRKAGNYEVVISSAAKLFWPSEKISKGMLADYYQSIAPFILPHLKERPLSLKRNPNGILDQGFYHKDAGEDAPPYASVFQVPNEQKSKIIDYLVCNNTATLLYLVNLGCIEMNPWNSTRKKPDHPTWMVIDLDPSDKNDFRQVIEAAQATHEVLKKLQVKGYCKTSGASGIHVYVPMKNKFPYEIVKEFAQVVASMVNEMLPSTTTLERMKNKRGDRIYVDYLQNRIGQTLASAYSIRPMPGATASAPLDWKEVKYGLHPTDFTIRNLTARARKKGDLFAPVLTESTALRKALKLAGA